MIIQEHPSSALPLSALPLKFISCTRLRATVTESTCIARQKKIAVEFARRNKGNKFNGPGWGYDDIDGALTAFRSCVDCPIGLRLAKKR